MGLVNARNLRRAKQLLDKNRHKIGDVVEKASTQLDKASNGKTSNFTSKATDAAKKYSASGVTHHGMDESAPDTKPHGDPLADDAERVGQPHSQRSATTSAAGAVAGAASALTNFMNKAAAKAEGKNAATGGPSKNPHVIDVDPVDADPTT